MERVIVKKNGYGYNLAFNITDDNDNPKDILGYTLVLQVWDEYAPGTVKWTLTGAIIDAEGGLADFAVVAGDFNEAGVFLGQIELTKAGVVEPGDTYQLIVKDGP